MNSREGEEEVKRAVAELLREVADNIENEVSFATDYTKNVKFDTVYSRAGPAARIKRGVLNEITIATPQGELYLEYDTER